MIKNEQKRRAAIYIRVSTVEQAKEGYSLPAQERKLRDYCSLKDYVVYKVYADEGKSAKDIKHRPQMQQLINDGLQGKFDVVVVWSLTRFTRKLTDLCITCDKLEKHGVYLESYSESFDSHTAVGRMIRGILGVIAQWQLDETGNNVKLAMEERAKLGQRTCGRILGYDTVGGQMIVNKKEAEIVKFIFDTYEKERKFTMVAEHCRKRGYTGKYGSPCSPHSVSVILTQFIYCGYFGWHRQPIKADFHPIISVEQYNRVQAIIDSTGKKSGRKRIHPLVYL